MSDWIHHSLALIDWNAIGVWTLTGVLMTAGLVGTVMPLLPGPLLIFIASLVHVLLRPQSGVTWWCVAWLGLLTCVAYALDFASGALGAKAFGGSRWGIFGVIAGGLVGLFFPFPGLIVGPVVGGFACELLFAGKALGGAAKSTWGALVGTGMGLVARLVTAIVMVVSFFIDAFWI